ncbi:hypothetical protein UlMin_012102 [Ulmus minor]
MISTSQPFFDDKELFPISDEKYAEELQFQEALIKWSIFTCFLCDLYGCQTNGRNVQKRQLHPSFCEDCLGKYIGTKIQENIAMVKFPEPKCKGILEPQLCCSIVPKEAFERWENALCESLGVDVTICGCPNCHKLFCAQCNVAWHAGMECGEFKSRKNGERDQREDNMVMELAKQKNWRRCPGCNFYVEKTAGCLHISCRCGNEFCYGCGSKWSSSNSC